MNQENFVVEIYFHPPGMSWDWLRQPASVCSHFAAEAVPRRDLCGRSEQAVCAQRPAPMLNNCSAAPCADMFAILARHHTSMLSYGNECERSTLLCSACVRRAEAGFAGLPTAIGLGGRRVIAGSCKDERSAPREWGTWWHVLLALSSCSTSCAARRVLHKEGVLHAGTMREARTVLQKGSSGEAWARRGAEVRTCCTRPLGEQHVLCCTRPLGI